jgi:uncharacterized protein YjbI with pentapeptide repeats
LADPEHTALAKAGAHAIARWREQIYWRRRSMDLSGAYLSDSKMPGVDLAHDNLSNADLTNSDLRLADFSGVNLQGAHLWRSDLTSADFRRANLRSASLVRCKLRGSSLHAADLSGADLSYADLWCANLSEANLQGANLTEANLAWADLSGADLRDCRLTATNLEVANLAGADLRGAYFIRPRLRGASVEDCLFETTLLADCDLSCVKGLGTTRHRGPSIVGSDSLARSKGLIPEDFLRQAGVAEPFIAAQEEIRRTGKTMPKILLVNSVTDATLAARIQGGLREAGIQSWTLAADDEEVLRADQGALERIIYYDLLVLVCSTQALVNPHCCRVFGQLEPAAAADWPRLVTVATDDLLYTRQDSLCTRLRQTEVVDLRGWDDEGSYQEGLACLVTAIAKADG